jgi:peptidoglycan-N-acetylglucosamine deacetylase
MNPPNPSALPTTLRRPAAATPWWRATPLLQASAACHLGAGVAVATAPTIWPWALGALALNHAALTGAGLWPRSNWLGENLSRLPAAAAARSEISLTIDDGPDAEVTPAVLDLLDAHSAQATFFCIADRVSRHPALAREIVRRGHSVQNHSMRHTHRFSLLGPKGFEREVGQAQDTIAQVIGEAPRFFRAPAGLRNPFLDATLQRFDLRLVSWTRRGFDTVKREPATVLAKLTRQLGAGDILLLHDGHAARTHQGRAVVLDVLPALLARFSTQGLRAVTLTQALTGPRPAA